MGRGGVGGHVCWPRWGSATKLSLAGALFYLVPSALASSAAFLLVGSRRALAERARRLVDEAPFLNAKLESRATSTWTTRRRRWSGGPFPASTALLGFAYLACALLIAGLPPLAERSSASSR